MALVRSRGSIVGWGRAFTVVELLVVVAVTAVLVGILAPALSGARIAAQRAACASMQRQLVVGLATYCSANYEWIPGYNSSGNNLWSNNPDGVTIGRANRSGLAAVQTNDWITPSMGTDALPRNREHRFFSVLEIFADPAMVERPPAWIAGGRGNREMAEWLEANSDRPARGVSYLMPANFQLFGSGKGPRRITQDSSTSLKELKRQHRLAADYVPRIDRVGSAARKIALADGFRYISHNEFDSDFSYHASYNWGCFTDRSACSIESTPWGHKGGDGAGLGMRLSYRHAGAMNAAFWDGHVQSLDQRESRNPALWAPTRSVFVGKRSTTYKEAFEFGYRPWDDDPAGSILE